MSPGEVCGGLRSGDLRRELWGADGPLHHHRPQRGHDAGAAHQRRQPGGPQGTHARTHARTRTHGHADTDTQTRTHTDTHTRTHSRTHTHTYRHRQTHTQTDRQTQTDRHTRTCIIRTFSFTSLVFIVVLGKKLMPSYSTPLNLLQSASQTIRLSQCDHEMPVMVKFYILLNDYLIQMAKFG